MRETTIVRKISELNITERKRDGESVRDGRTRRWRSWGTERERRREKRRGEGDWWEARKGWMRWLLLASWPWRPPSSTLLRPCTKLNNSLGLVSYPRPHSTSYSLLLCWWLSLRRQAIKFNIIFILYTTILYMEFIHYIKKKLKYNSDSILKKKHLWILQMYLYFYFI